MYILYIAYIICAQIDFGDLWNENIPVSNRILKQHNIYKLNVIKI